ncbi:hypothetical protein [Burkholderia plantarii]|uniref:Uncharacterized protein n=1 Tax=Burkholderia plantarii TaxID=41899 RepID=A0A0B6RUV3_BURPL|nr:hypothetical protein [Burkholderia plantarii]AJK47183.1 hypothetical protein BGL_1c26990 [Burkholderia plantarii]
MAVLDSTREAIPPALIAEGSGHPARDACNERYRNGCPARPIASTKNIGIAEDTRGTIDQSASIAPHSVALRHNAPLMHRHPARRASSLARTSLGGSSGMLDRHRSGPTRHFLADDFGQSIQLIKLQ